MRTIYIICTGAFMVCRAVFAVFVSVLAVCWVTQLSLPVSLLLMVLLVLLGCARPVVTSAVSTSHERSLQKTRQTVTGYCREVEALLSLLSLCLRTVHEAEMVARQFTRPLVARNVPVEDGYQCLGLRCCLFSVCQGVVEGLRNATLLLSQQYPSPSLILQATLVYSGTPLIMTPAPFFCLARKTSTLQ
jgi:hypothetical protein